MSCACCALPLDGKLTEAPCCDLKAHSACFIKHIASHMMSFSTYYCLCGAMLYQHVQVWETDNDVTTATAESIKEKEGVKEEIKVLRKKGTVASKAYNEFSKILKTESSKFHETVDDALNAIKTQKAAAMNTIKQTPEFKAYRSAHSSLLRCHSIFMKKHDASWRVMRRLGLQKRWRYRMVSYEIKRKFRIRI